MSIKIVAVPIFVFPIFVYFCHIPAALPEFFIKMLTNENDLVLDPFAGSNVTGFVAEKLQRRWIAVECVPEYIKTSKLRFD